MSAPTTTALRPLSGPRMAWLPIALVFVVGASIGAVASAAVTAPTTPVVSDVPAAATSSSTELNRLLGDMDAAAQRGDTRLFYVFRADLSQLIGSADISQYRTLRGIDASAE